MSLNFFLLYKARSGSTYLAELLSHHPEICMTLESNFVPRLWHWGGDSNKVIDNEEDLVACLRFVYEESKLELWNLEHEEIFQALLGSLPLSVSDVGLQIVNDYCQRIFPEASIYGVKKGGWYTKNVNVLWEMFPNAKIVHLIRDGRAVYASAKRAVHSETKERFESDPAESAFHWRELMMQSESYQASSLYHEVRYEDLLTRPQQTLSTLLKFLGVNSVETQMDSLFQSQPVQMVHQKIEHLHPHVGKEPILERITAWQHELTQAEIKTFEQIAGHQLVKKGYELQYPEIRPAPFRAMNYKLRVQSKRIMRYLHSRVR